MRDTEQVRVSVVVPMLNESANLGPLLERIFAVMGESGEEFEVIAVDDGSTDDTLARLQAEQSAKPELRVVELARNFGQHAAVMAGFEASRGEWVITMDADLQNPPEEVPKLLAALREGHDLVNTYRDGRQDSLFRRLASRVTNVLVRRWSGIGLRDFGCMLRAYHRDVIAGMLRRKEFGTFIPALAMLYAKDPVEIAVEHSARTHGRSAYSVLRLLSLQADLVTSFSVAPLRLLFGFGWLMAFAGLALAVLLVVLRLVLGAAWAAEGVFTLFAVLFFFVGAQFLALGLLGEYIGRIYQEVRDRPTYLVRGEPAADDKASSSHPRRRQKRRK